MDKVSRFLAALDAFTGRVQADRNVLAVALIGSLSDERLWKRDEISVWVIIADGLTRRRKSDGEEPRVFRTLVENDISIVAEVIERARFKQMVEGQSRTAFTHSFFAQRSLAWSRDESITRWFDDANALSSRDQVHERFHIATWMIHGTRQARRTLEVKKDLHLAAGEVIHLAWAVAALAVVDAGAVVEGNALYWARDREPEQFDRLYQRVLDRNGDVAPVEAALSEVEALLTQHADDWLAPLTRWLRKAGVPVPLSQICDHWAHSPLYPWHLRSACEWLVRRGDVELLAAGYKLTKKSRVDVEEPAYQWVGG